MYGKFVELAAFDRQMSFEHLEKLARGRVYTGVEAKEVSFLGELWMRRGVVLFPRSSFYKTYLYLSFWLVATFSCRFLSLGSSIVSEVLKMLFLVFVSLPTWKKIRVRVCVLLLRCRVFSSFSLSFFL